LFRNPSLRELGTFIEIKVEFLTREIICNILIQPPLLKIFEVTFPTLWIFPILRRLQKLQLPKIEAWDILEKGNVGANQLKKVRFQTMRRQYELMQMEDT